MPYCQLEGFTRALERLTKPMVDQAERNAGAPVKEVLWDGAYDSARIYEMLKGKRVDAIIRPRKNSIWSTRSDARRREVDLYRCLGHGKWAEEKGYRRRWAIETAYSTFKRTFGESVMAKTMTSAVKELAAKVAIYNVLARM